MKPANRNPGPRPRTTSNAAQQGAIWKIIRAVQSQTGADAALYKTIKRDKFAPIVTWESRTARSQGDAK